MTLLYYTGGIPAHEMNSLEIEFLFMLNFNLFCDMELFKQYYMELCKHTLNSPCDCSNGIGVVIWGDVPGTV